MRLRALAIGAMPAPLLGQFRQVTLDPGHFHAALFQWQALAELADESYVYAPLGPDLTAPPESEYSFLTAKYFVRLRASLWRGVKRHD